MTSGANVVHVHMCCSCNMINRQRVDSMQVCDGRFCRKVGCLQQQGDKMSNVLGNHHDTNGCWAR